MGFWNSLKNELIDIIEWLDDSHDTMVYRFARHDNEIKYGAKLIVREGQCAIFINEGQLEQPKPQKWNVMEYDASKQSDVFEAGTYTLDTKNLPILSTLQGWKYGFDSPFKAEVYFINTTRFTHQKWGTPNPIMVRDPEFGPLRLRAFGSYSLKIKNPVLFLREVSGTKGRFTTENISDELRSLIVSRFTDTLGESKLAALDLASNYDELGRFVTQKMQDDFLQYGLELKQLVIGNISLPPAVTEALDKRSSMGVLGNLQQYSQFQAANAIEQAAKNPSGAASEGMAMGAGFAMASQMAQQFNQPQTPAPMPPPPQTTFHVAVNGQTTGPFDLHSLSQQLQTGQFTRHSLVWRAGMSQWQAAGEVAELKNLLAAIPPPIPPTL